MVESVLAANKATGLLVAKGFLADGNSCFVCFFVESPTEVSEAWAQRLINSSRSW